MKAYIITLLILFGLEIGGKIMMLAESDTRQRTPKSVGWELTINIILVVWGVALLVSA